MQRCRRNARSCMAFGRIVDDDPGPEPSHTKAGMETRLRAAKAENPWGVLILLALGLMVSFVDRRVCPRH
jgi:hypothetical protein